MVIKRYNTINEAQILKAYEIAKERYAAIREFWIEHTKRCRRIADAMGKAQGDPCILFIAIIADSQYL